ncbi:MAG: hypothetical protein C4518_16935 [Desulfobacteraceae bacterium]|nr:MAG: hypothetical protein C4518_16935 [Desulfobacteraceae bacterium]
MHLNQSFKPKKDSHCCGNPGTVFIFLAGLNFWEGLFDNVNIKFINNLLAFHLADFSCVLMTIITPDRLSDDKAELLREKEEQIKKLAAEYGIAVEFCHIRGRTITGLLSVLKEIRKKTMLFEKRFVWASNYFNCFLGVLIKQRLPNTRLHFEMMGLVPEEELLYSETRLAFKIINFLTLKGLCRINIRHADSISVVSKRFKQYIVARYGLSPSLINVIPCFYDDKVFFVDHESRSRFRSKYQISDNQKLILYSGMLQNWQMPDVLFAFFQKIQLQDDQNAFRFMIATFDLEKARSYALKYGIKDLIVDTASGSDLNGIYNAADIGISTRSDDWVSRVSSPVKIPEYLATQNSLILLESIGDYGFDLKNKKYAIVKKNKEDLLNTSFSELRQLEKPNQQDIICILNNYGVQKYLPVIQKILSHDPA